MTLPQYKEKELTIMRALMKLIAEGMHLRDIKAADIARAAQIGKGTLYNYYESKEAMIAQTIIYSIKTELQSIRNRVESMPCFREKCYEMLRCAYETVTNENSDFHLMLLSVGSGEIKQYLKDDMCFIDECLDFVFEETLRLARLGKAEGIICPPEDGEYTYSAFAGAFMSFVHAVCRMKKPDEKTLHAAMDRAYIILLKTLQE